MDHYFHPLNPKFTKKKKNQKFIAIFRLEWNEQANNELRVIVIAFAMTQMIREAFPSLIHILKEHRLRS